MNPMIKLILRVLGIIAAVVAAVLGWNESDVRWMFLLGWGAIALLGASGLP